MNKSDAINELAAALSKAQATIKNPEFDAENTFFRKSDGSASKYATLAAIRDAVTPELSKNGIAVLQDLRFDAASSTVHCTTLLIHSSGQWIEVGPFSAPAVPSTAKDGRVLPLNSQNVCASSTYLRRYSLQAAINVVGDHDDDGESAAGRGGDAPERPQGGYKPKYQKTATPDPLGPVGEIPDHSAAAPAANAEPAAGRPSVAVGFLHSLAASSTEGQIDGLTKQIALVSKSIAEPEKVKLSFRSEPGIDVNQLARTWGGGGHRHAAGAQIQGPLDAVVKQVIAAAKGLIAD